MTGSPFDRKTVQGILKFTAPLFWNVVLT